ncbi:MAG: hypothetical protein SX243_25160 [Acidobacteriota bacterium]|nr:hypothetical protein [Acidobacteriota bacterium]
MTYWTLRFVPISVFAMLLVGLVGCLSQASSAVAEDASWRHLALWDDGKAEYAVYEVDWARYGDRFPGRALLVLVKEPWAPDLEVKADTPREDGFDVIKLNHIRDVPTGVYTYHQMASLFWRREGGELQKLASSSAEACGLSTGFMVGGELETRSYFDGQGQRQQPWPDDALAQDGLPASLRQYVTGPVPETLSIFPTLLTGAFPPLQATAWKLSRGEERTVEVPAGSFSAVELRLEQGERFLRYTFGTEAPHVLLQFEDSQGTEYRLAKVERIPYWAMHDAGDEEWIPAYLRFAPPAE